MLFYQDLIKKSAAKKVKLEKLPAVFPILLYNGEDKWQPHAIPGSGCTRASGPSDTPVELKDLIEVRYEALGKYIPNFAYYKIIENEFSQESLKELKSINASLFRLEMAGDKEIGKCALRLTRILKKEANPELKRDFRLWLNQLIRGYGIKPKEVDKIIDELEAGKVTNLESNIKKIKKESEEKGIEKGIVKGVEIGTERTRKEERAKAAKERKEIARKMLLRGDNVSDVAEITSLSEAEIKKLKTTLKKVS